MMIDTIKHEPTWASGMHVAPALGVYTGWVAHDRSFSQSQSACSEENVVLSFSGECFTQPENAYSFSMTPTHRDAPREPSLCSLYTSRGDRFVEDLNGLFSGLLIDLARKRALLFNDRY